VNRRPSEWLDARDHIAHRRNGAHVAALNGMANRMAAKNREILIDLDYARRQFAARQKGAEGLTCDECHRLSGARAPGLSHMSSQDEPGISVAPARRNHRARLKAWAARRARQISRLLSILGFALFLGAGVFWVWRQASLLALPDVGDPFDVAAMEAGAPTADHDAFAIFGQARRKLIPRPELPKAVLNAGPTVGWSNADPKLRQWVELNREALNLFKQAAEQDDGRGHTRHETVATYEHVYLGFFVWLALLESSRLEEQGDIAGAWEWHRAVIGMRAHIMRRGTAFERLFACYHTAPLRGGIAQWAANPKTQASDLRRAVADCNANEPRPEWESSSLKVDYMLAIGELERSGPARGISDDEMRDIRFGGEPLPPNLAESAVVFRRFLIREPERSRRVLQLVFANWLAHVDCADERQQKPAVRAKFLSGSIDSTVFLYPTGKAAPAAASRIGPERLAEWLMTAPDAKRILCQWPWPSLSRQERGEFHGLRVVLAEELYRREHGHSPSEDELAATYLKGSPDDGTADFDDGTALTVEDPRLSAPRAQPQ
jgi:hypothetical protein